MNNQVIKMILVGVLRRFTDAIEGTNEEFGNLKVNDNIETPLEIINRIYDLIIKMRFKKHYGHFNCPSPKTTNWNLDIERIIKSLTVLIKEYDDKAGDKDLVTNLVQKPLFEMIALVGRIELIREFTGIKIERNIYFA